MNVQTKITVLLAGIVSVLCGLILFIRYTDMQRVKLLQVQETRESDQVVTTYLDLNQRSLELFVYDYTYWDDLMAFVSHPDPVWAEANLNAVIGKFDVQQLWVYDSQFRPIYATGVRNLRAPLSGGTIKEIMGRNAFPHFFVALGDTMIEIRGAPIQPSLDKERSTKPGGYLLAGRLWDRDHLDKLEKILNASARVVPSSSRFRPGTPDSLTVYKTLWDWQNAPLAELELKTRFEMGAEILRVSDVQLILVIVLAVLVAVPLLIFMTFWISKPLRILSTSLANRDERPLKPLQNDSGEFGDIARMIGRSMNQYETLQLEMESRTETEKALKSSERDYRRLFEQAFDAILVVSAEDGRILQVNPQACVMYGIKPDQWTAMKLSDLWHDCPPDFLKTIADKLFLSGVEATHVKRRGQEIVVEMNASWIEYQNAQAILCVNRDITLKKIMEEIHLSHRVLNQINNLVLVSDSEGRIIFANRACELLFDCTQAELLGEGWWDKTVSDPADRKRAIETESRRARGELSSDTTYERSYRNPHGKTIWIEWYDYWDPGKIVISVGADITDRKRAETAATELQSQRVRLAAVVQTQEQERKRIAKELHDSLGQELSALRHQLEYLLAQPGTEKDGFAKAIDTLSHATAETRTIAYNLMPAALEDLGLVTAIETLARRQFEKTPTEVTVGAFPNDQRYAPEIELGLYRIVQEAINNITKHSMATRATVQISRIDGRILMLIEDNGNGFDPTAVKPGLGLVNMRERVEFLNGKLDIDSSPGNGTTLVVEVPVGDDHGTH